MSTIELEPVIETLNSLKKFQGQFTWTKEKAQYNEAIDDAIHALKSAADPNYVRPRKYWAGPY